ncbi:MAG: hypothetical protein O2967_11310 [Proteobacteria bacterium]|nr:hypothetical protein [Pseudomonadota bacterium]
MIPWACDRRDKVVAMIRRTPGREGAMFVTVTVPGRRQNLLPDCFSGQRVKGSPAEANGFGFAGPCSSRHANLLRPPQGKSSTGIQELKQISRLDK